MGNNSVPNCQLDQCGLSVSDKPLFHLSVAYEVDNSEWDWFRFMSTDFSKMSVYDIDRVCKSLNRSGYATGIIYMYTNLENGKRYIGQTISPRNRNKSHNEINNLKKQHPFYNAIRKYGRGSFDYRVIGFVAANCSKDRQERLDKLEREIIALYRTTERDYGYNILEGGQGGPHNNHPNVRKIFQYDLNGGLVAVHPSVSEAERACGFYVRGCLAKSHYANGFIFLHENEINMLNDVIAKHQKRPVYQYDLDGKLINEYPDAASAASELNLNQRQLTTTLWLNNPNRTYKGYRWLYSKQSYLHKILGKY